jgi:pyruvate dehydrogenase E1 component alpha subunit
MMAEIAGKETGYCSGKGGSMHIADMKLGHLGANAIVGGGIPSVVGAGLAARHKKSDAVSVAFFGDGATGQGVLYESMNMTALWQLPVLFVCINNQYGMGTRIDNATAAPDIHKRADPFGLKGASVDGTDVEAVAEIAGEMISDARAGKPGLLVVDCYRFYGHARMDKSPYRDDAEETQGRLRDPVIKARQTLISRGEMGDTSLDEMDQHIAAEMDATIDFAADAREPQLDSIFDDVYDPSAPPPESVRDRLARILGQTR